jgi:hypothetical protein
MVYISTMTWMRTLTWIYKHNIKHIMFVWVIQCIVKLVEFYRDSAPLIVDLFKYSSKHSLLSLYSTITRYWDDIVLTGANLCSFCYCLIMFILRRKSNGWEGRLSLTGLTAPHFCDCPKHVYIIMLRKKRKKFFQNFFKTSWI